MYQVYLRRITSNEKQTRGMMHVMDGDELVHSYYTLEPPDRNNKPFISRIPAGRYRLMPYTRRSGAKVYEVANVPGRKDILIHSGAMYYHTQGCILPGTYFGDLDNDGYVDMVGSKAAMVEIMSLDLNGSWIQIIDEHMDVDIPQSI
jgi:hypothetical protein